MKCGHCKEWVFLSELLNPRVALCNSCRELTLRPTRKILQPVSMIREEVNLNAYVDGRSGVIVRQALVG
jgi:hypothetical protein